jgi:hypothetical protein
MNSVAIIIGKCHTRQLHSCQNFHFRKGVHFRWGHSNISLFLPEALNCWETCYMDRLIFSEHAYLSSYAQKNFKGCVNKRWTQDFVYAPRIFTLLRGLMVRWSHMFIQEWKSKSCLFKYQNLAWKPSWLPVVNLSSRPITMEISKIALLSESYLKRYSSMETPGFGILSDLLESK